MRTRSSFLFTYRQLLRLYPASFRQRFAEEMIEVAELAEASDWPLILGDAGVSIVRSWLEPSAIRTRPLATIHGQYVSLGESPVNTTRMLQGLGVATALVLLACYISTVTVWNLPVIRPALPFRTLRKCL